MFKFVPVKGNKYDKFKVTYIVTPFKNDFFKLLV